MLVSRLWLVARLSLVAFVVPFSACKRSSAPQPEITRRAPVAAPAGLVAEIIVAHPDRTWDTVRSKLRATTSLVPSSPAVFLGGALGLPLGVLEQLDFNIPIVGAIIEDAGALTALAAIHVKDGPRIVQAMTTSTPRFVVEAKPAAETVHLVPTTPDPTGPSFAVSGNYLVVGRSKDILERCAPFVTRTLPSRPVPTEDLTIVANKSALSGPIATRLAQFWRSWKKDREADDIALRAKHGGSAPDFGDPAEALADMDARAARFFAILGDFEEARLALTVNPAEPDAAERYRAIATLKARSTGPAADELKTMTVATMGPLLDLPAQAGIAFLTRDNGAVRANAATSQVEAMAKVFGGRLAANDKAKIETALHAFAKGRGDWLTGALVAAPSRAAVIRGAVSDPAALDQSAFAMLDLLSVRAIAEPIGNWIGDLKISGVDAARNAAEGERRAVHVVRRPPKVKFARDNADKTEKTMETDAFDIAWVVGKEVFVGAAGQAAKEALSSLEKPDETGTLARTVHLKNAAIRLGPTVAFALVVDLARLGAARSGAGEDMTLLLTYGKELGPESNAFIELEAPSGLVMSYAAGASTLLGSSP
jgi:hypothetical protein